MIDFGTTRNQNTWPNLKWLFVIKCMNLALGIKTVTGSSSIGLSHLAWDPYPQSQRFQHVKHSSVIFTQGKRAGA